jgi:serine/threonine protein kinase
MDFGIARLRDADGASQLTQTGMIMGTPAYMAPEQAEGHAVSERTDIYALGIVLYEMLSGSVPFKASTPAALLIKQIQETPGPLRVLRGEIPPNIERVVMQALEKAPEKRRRDMGEVADSLRLQAASPPVRGLRAPPRPQPRWCMMHLMQAGRSPGCQRRNNGQNMTRAGLPNSSTKRPPPSLRHRSYGIPWLISETGRYSSRLVSRRDPWCYWRASVSRFRSFSDRLLKNRSKQRRPRRPRPSATAPRW